MRKGGAGGGCKVLSIIRRVRTGSTVHGKECCDPGRHSSFCKGLTDQASIL